MSQFHTCRVRPVGALQLKGRGVVYIGKFDTLQEAQEAQAQLEAMPAAEAAAYVAPAKRAKQARTGHCRRPLPVSCCVVTLSAPGPDAC